MCLASGSPRFHHPPSPVCSGGIPMKERHVLCLWAEAHGCGNQRCQELMLARTGLSVNLLLWSSGDSTARTPQEPGKRGVGTGEGGGRKGKRGRGADPRREGSVRELRKDCIPLFPWRQHSGSVHSPDAQFTPQTLAEDMLCPRPRREAGGAAGMPPKESRPWWRTHSDGGKTSQEP